MNEIILSLGIFFALENGMTISEIINSVVVLKKWQNWVVTFGFTMPFLVAIFFADFPHIITPQFSFDLTVNAFFIKLGTVLSSVLFTIIGQFVKCRKERIFKCNGMK